MSKHDKQLEAEARELYDAHRNEREAILRWDDLWAVNKIAWLRVAAKARELADERYRPLVEAATQAVRVMGAAGGPMIRVRRELDKLKGGGG